MFQVGGDGAGGEAAAAASEANREAREAEARVAVRKKQWEEGQIPDEFLSTKNTAEPKHSVVFRKPRPGGSRMGDISEEHIKDPTKRQELFDHKVLRWKKKKNDQGEEIDVPEFDAYGEFGGEENYREFLNAFLDSGSTNPDKLFMLSKQGIIPKAGISQEQISLAFEVWEQKKKVDEVKQQQKAEEVMADEGGVVVPEQQGAKSLEEKLSQENEKLAQKEDELRKQSAVDKSKEDEKTPITNEEANQLADLVRRISQQQAQIEEQISKLSPNESKDELFQKLNILKKEKIEAILTGLGFTQQEILDLEEKGVNEISIIFKLARKTSLRKEKGEGVKNLNDLLVGEIGGFISRALNSVENKISDWDSIKSNPGLETLRKLMNKLGIEEDQIDNVIHAFKLATTKSGEPLGIAETTSLQDILGAIVNDKSLQNIPLRGFNLEFQKFSKEVQKQTIQSIKKTIGKIIQDNPLFKIPDIVSAFLEEGFDPNAFMDFLFTGESRMMAFRDMGYKSEEELLHEGKKPVGVKKIEEYLNSGDKNERVKRMLLSGVRDNISPKDYEELQALSVQDLLKNDFFLKEYQHTILSGKESKFAIGVLCEVCDSSEDDVLREKYELTDEAMVYLQEFPTLYKEKSRNVDVNISV